MTDPETSNSIDPPSERTRLKRYNWLAKYDRETINAIIDAGIVCQVGYVIEFSALRDADQSLADR